MASRIFREVPWQAPSLGGLGFLADFVDWQADGWRMESLSLAGVVPNPSAVCMWRDDLGDTPAQEVTGLLSLQGLAGDLEERLPDGWGLALLAGTRSSGGDDRFLAVWERFDPASTPPKWRISQDFGAFSGGMYNAELVPMTLHARSIGVIPGIGAGPHTYLATLWPFPGTRFAWGVSQLRCEEMKRGHVEQSPEAVAWSAVSYPWAVVPFAHQGTPLLLTSWRDVIFDPWTKEPFDRAAHRERHFRCDPWVPAGDFSHLREVRESEGLELLHASASGAAENKAYSALWIRKAEKPLPRRFVLNGIGDGTNAVRAPTRVPGSDLGGDDDGPDLERRPTAEDGRARPEVDWPYPIDDLLERVMPGVSVEARRPGEWTRGLRAGGRGSRGVAPDVHATRRPRISAELGAQRTRPGSPARFEGAGGVPRGGPQPGDGPGAPGGGLGTDDDGPEPGLEPPPPEGKHPLDAVMELLMRTYGPRAAQLAVLRKGQLKFLRSYTFAEAGYPVTHHTHRMRSGSVPKALTATPLALHYMGLVPGDPLAGLETPFAEALAIHRTFSEPGFDAITIKQAMQHRSGIEEKEMGGLGRIYEVAHGQAAIGEAFMADLRAGDMRLAFEKWPTPLVTEPGSGGYNNFVFVALTELWGKLGSTGWDKYVDAAREQLPPPLQVLPTMLTGATYADCTARKEVPYHDARIQVAPSPWYEEEGRWDTASYRGCPQFGTGAGWWALSALEMAMVMRQLTDRPNDLWPTFEEKLLILQERLGWAPAAHLFEFRGASFGLPGDRGAIWHNGALGGAVGVVGHFFRPATTLDIVATFNGGAFAGDLGGDLLGLLQEAAQDVEDRDDWTELDLFGAV